MGIFVYIGTPAENAVAQEAFESRCTFDWELLRPKLEAGTEWSQPKSEIPVEWADLSRYATVLEEAAASGGHAHIHEDGDTGHPITRDESMYADRAGRPVSLRAGQEPYFRKRVLGLAWYSGKVSIDSSLLRDPTLAMEVALSEGAHMIDFFYMTPEMREETYEIFHTEGEAPHDHGWFEETGNHDYWSWVGEAFMGGFVKAFSDIPVTLDSFVHKLEAGEEVELREALMPTTLQRPYFGTRTSRVFHDAHLGIPIETTFTTFDEAVAAGRRACRVCKPRATI